MTQFLDNVGYDDLASLYRERGMMRRARIATALVANILFAVLLCAALCGCSSTPTGVRVTATAVSATNLADINYDEYKWPVFSVYTGPKVVMWINKDFAVLKSVTASWSVTNDTHALGVYSSKEQKQTRVEIEFAPTTPAATPPITNETVRPVIELYQQKEIPVTDYGIMLTASDVACPLAGAQASADATTATTAKHGEAQ